MAGKMQLIQHLIKVKNKSGAIKPAPEGLAKLKEQLKGVPFALETPGMSGVINAKNLVAGIQKLVKSMGSLQAVGDFKNILGKANAQGKSGTEISDADAARIAASVPMNELVEAVGDATSLTASLSNYG